MATGLTKEEQVDEQTQTADPTGVARWTRLASLGLLLAGLGPLLMFVAGLLWGLSVGEDGAFFLITGAIGLVASFLVRRFGAWSKVVGILAALALMMALFWTAFGLFTPTAFFDFVPGLMVIPGGLVALVCCVAALVAGRRGHRTAAPEGGEQRGIRILLTAIIALAAVSAVLTFLGRTSVDNPGNVPEVALSDFEFDQGEYTVEAGSEVFVTNEDPFLHTFTIDELDVDEAFNPDVQKLIEIPDDPGTYVVYCRPHTFDPKNPSDDDMAATITVE